MENHEPQPLRSVALEHLGLLISGAFAFLVVYRLLALARWDTQTAAAILQHSGSANLILGVAISAAPAIITDALWLVGGLLFYRWARDRSWPGFLWYGLLTVVTTMVGFTIATSSQLCFMLVVWGGAAFIGQVDRAADPQLARAQNQRIVLGSLMGLVLGTVVMSEASWLPREALTPEDQDPFTGYVLGTTESDQWVVLRDDSREVEFISADKAGPTRTLCDEDGGGPGEWFWQRPIDLLDGVAKADYPECPEP